MQKILIRALEDKHVGHLIRTVMLVAQKCNMHEYVRMHFRKSAAAPAAVVGTAICKCVTENGVRRRPALLIYIFYFFHSFSMDRNRGAPQVYGNQTGVAQWEAKHVNPSSYGRDISLHEALDDAVTFDNTLHTMKGILTSRCHTTCNWALRTAIVIDLPQYFISLCDKIQPGVEPGLRVRY